MEGGERGSSAIPESVMNSVNTTLVNVENLRTHLLQFLSLSDPDVLAEMPPLQRAQALFTLAKATTTLFALRLKCSGVHPDEHPIKSELERLSLYQDKLERFIDLSKAPLRPSTTLNSQAATRFIEHSLPDLTPEQRLSMRQISKGDSNVKKKRKYQSSEKQSVQDAAKEFLEKASRELFGDRKDGFKGPLQALAYWKLYLQISGRARISPSWFRLSWFQLALSELRLPYGLATSFLVQLHQLPEASERSQLYLSCYFFFVPQFLVQLHQLPEAGERSQLYLCYSFLSHSFWFSCIGYQQEVKEASCTCVVTLFGFISSGCATGITLSSNDEVKMALAIGVSCGVSFARGEHLA
ncbi:hypothetical protein GQ457_07G043960 [Hibiscus cannabinus]